MSLHSCYKCLMPLNNIPFYGLHPECFEQWFHVPAQEAFSNIVRHGADSDGLSDAIESGIYWRSSFFQGKFKKYSATLGERDYIIKVQEAFAPELPMVEYLCNQIASSLSLNIPDYFFIDFYEAPCFLSLNFTSAHTHAFTLNHLYHYVDNEQEYCCEHLMRIIEKIAGKFSDVETFINICLYDALIGNHDRHGRNLGFLAHSANITLAPMYDNTSALGLESGPMLAASFNPRGKIATSTTREPTMADYAREFIRLSARKNVHAFFERINMETILVLIDNSFCSDLMKKAMKKLIQARYQELHDVLRAQ